MNNCMATNQINKVENFLKTYKLPKMIQEKLENLNRPLTNKDMGRGDWDGEDM